MQPDFLVRLNSFNSQFEAIVRSLERRGAKRVEAEDIAQHAFLEACRVPGDRWAEIRNPRAWIHRVALNRYLKSRRYETPVGQMRNDAAPGPWPAELVDQALDVATALKRLDNLTSDVMVLRLEDVPTREIAQHLGINQQKVWNHVAKARRDLRSQLTSPVQRPAPASVVAGSQSLLADGSDLRAMSPDERQETRTAVAEWRERLRRCRAGDFGAEGSVIILEKVATLAEALIADRDEQTALNLVRDAAPHLRFLGSIRPSALKVRRARAEALSETGQYWRAETILRELSEDEQRVFGVADPRTALLLNWALVGQGRLREAEAGLCALETGLRRSPGSETLLLHVQCRHAWLRGRLGQVDESVSAYTRVISGRTGGLSHDHPDTLDARHSQAKTLVVAGRGSLALSLLQDLSEVRARVQSDHHSDTLETRKYRSVAEVLLEPRDDRVLNNAIHDLEEVFHTQTHRHGQDHPMSRDTDRWRNWLRRVQKANRFSEPVPSL